jgi:hypothetical protein
MPKVEVDDEFPVPPDFLLSLLEGLLGERKWRLNHRGPGHYTVRFGALNALTDNMRLEIVLEDLNGGARVRYKGSAFGLVRGGAVRDTVYGIRQAVQESVRMSLEMQAHMSQIEPPPDPEQTLRQLQRLREDGLIGEQEFQAKRREILERF